jgi:serine/threonine protein kinase
VIKIADFGSATLFQEQNKEFEIEGFTRWYKSPEQLFGSRTYDFSIDMGPYWAVRMKIIGGG